jgi:SAM-dependent methyltransferase
MDNQAIQIFDFERIKANRSYALDHLQESNFLIEKSVDRIIDNLKDIQRDFENIAIIGSRGADKIKACFRGKSCAVFDVVEGADILMEEEIPLLEKQSCDCIIALPYLHTVNNVQIFLSMIKAALKPDGLFLCSFFGGETLKELRQSILQIEVEKTGGAAQHIHPMIDHYQFAGLLQSAGFGLPVVDFDRVLVHYKKLDSLYDDIKNMGEGNALADKPRSIAAMKKDIETYYKDHFYDEGFIATFDILHGIGWAPHDSQQKPARRGSGQVSLTEVL